MESLHYMWLCEHDTPDHDMRQLQAINLVIEKLPSYHSQNVEPLQIKPRRKLVLVGIGVEAIQAYSKA